MSIKISQCYRFKPWCLGGEVASYSLTCLSSLNLTVLRERPVDLHSITSDCLEVALMVVDVGWGGWRRRTEKHSTVARGGAWRVACTDKIQPFRHALPGSSLHPGPDWRGEWLQSRQLLLLTESIDTHRVSSRLVSKDKPYFLQNIASVCRNQYNKAKPRRTRVTFK